ncbi:MAG: LysM peptidoglycan-binding domain-containing protein [Candidatus Desantisbacteria bacterium]
MSKRLMINILLVLFIFSPTISWGEIYHTVKGNETLWRIAKKYGISVEELRQSNNLRSNLICKGQQLCIQKQVASQIVTPLQNTKKEERQGAEIVQETTKPQTLHSQNSYVVKKSDTLFSIARRNGCTVGELKRINHLTDNTIEISQVLLLSATTINYEAKTANPETQTPNIEPQILSNEEEHQSASAENYIRLPVKEATPSAEEQYIPLAEYPGDIGPQIVNTAKRYLSLPYKSGGEIGDESTDCSGFVKRTFGYFGIKLPRSAREQFNMGTPVTELAEGDLVFFATYASYPSHVGIYIGDDKFIHSSSYRSGGVRIDSLESNYYHQRYLGARRVVSVE